MALLCSACAAFLAFRPAAARAAGAAVEVVAAAAVEEEEEEEEEEERAGEVEEKRSFMVPRSRIPEDLPEDLPPAAAAERREAALALCLAAFLAAMRWAPAVGKGGRGEGGGEERGRGDRCQER